MPIIMNGVTTSRVLRQHKVRSILTKLILFGASVALLFALYVAILRFPQPFFAYRATAGRLTLYSDKAFDPAKGIALLEQVEDRLKTSRLDDHRAYKIVVTNL